MLKSHLKKIISYFIISLFISSFAFGNDQVKSSDNSGPRSFFIIDYDVNIYRDKDSADVQTRVTFFDPVYVLSDGVSSNGRIKVNLQDGTKGWVEEKYTSYIPKNWKKLVLLENYYCYILSDEILDIKREDDKYGRMNYYSNSDIDIAMGVVFLNNYQQQFMSVQDTISMEIQGGHDKKLNWNREFTLGNYKINYIITTDHPDGGICESFDFVKLDEINIKKCYTVGVSYMPYESAFKKLLFRKMLFSTLQSLK